MFKIDENLFGYISKSNELTEDIIQRYKNSLIFIGDERQIYIPTTNSYVGVGMSTIENIHISNSSSDRIYISDVANSSATNPNTTYYFPVISNVAPHSYYYTYVAQNVGVNPITGKFIGGLQGTADYSTVSNLTYKNETKSTSNNSSYYITFANKMNGESYSYVNNKLLYNPHKEILTSTYFSGYLLGWASYASYTIYSSYSSYTSYSLFNSYQSIHNTNDNNIYHITFGKNSSYSLSYVNSQFYYNPALNCVYFGTAYGNIYGNAETLDGFNANELFQEFKNAGSQYTYIRIGNTDKKLKIDADKLDGKHLNEIFQEFRNGDNNCAYIKIGNTEKYVQLNSYTLEGLKKEDLFTFFGNDNEQTKIIIGGTTKTHYINSAYLQGYHVSELLELFSDGTISSSGNILTQKAHKIKIGGTEKSAGQSNNVKIINSAEWSYVGSTPCISNTTYNLVLRYKVNGINSTYAYLPKLYAYSATYIDGLSTKDLFTFFGNDNEQTKIIIGGTTKTHYINSAYLQGYHASELLELFSDGTISSSGNILTQKAHKIKIGGTEKSAGQSNNVKIINSAEWSYVGSTPCISNTTYNLVLRYKINGINSTYAYLPKLYAYSATYIDGLSTKDLFTFFGNDNEQTKIIIGGTTKTHYINSAYLQGYHASELLELFSDGTISSSGNILTQKAHKIKIGGTEKSAGQSNNVKIINSAEWSYVGSTPCISNTTYNLVLRYKINGINSTYAYLPKLYAYSATIADKLGTSTVGEPLIPIYLNNGIPTAFTNNVGNGAKPIYLYAGKITASTANIGSGTKPIFMSSGTLTESSSTVGSSSQPVYLNAGVITACTNVANSSHTHKIKLGNTEITIPAPGTTPTATTNISGPFAIDTNADSSKAFSIRRSSDAEGVKHWVDDAEYHIDYTNDEKSSSIHWRIINTDTESPASPPQTTDFHVYLTSNGEFRPGTNNTGSIGTSSYKWKYIYGTNIYGNLTGNVTGNVTGNLTGIADWAKLLRPISNTTTASASTWNIPSGCKQVWGERFTDSTLQYTPSGGSATTITDSGDWVIWLAPSATSNVATLNMRIDGTFYGSFAGNLTGNASTATKLGTSTIGSTTKGIYLDGGTPKAMTYELKATVNSGTSGKLAYYSGDTAISVYNSSVGNSAKPIYMYAGIPTASTANIGSGTKPIFMSSGTLTESSSTVGSGTKPIFMSSGTLTAFSATIGSSSQPVYLNAGVITACSSMALSGHTHTFAQITNKITDGDEFNFVDAEKAAIWFNYRRASTSAATTPTTQFNFGQGTATEAYANIKAQGFIKNGSSNNYLLRGGGGHIAFGNSNGNIPISNGTVNTNLNADLLDGYHASNLYTSIGDWISKVGNTKTVTVGGDSNTYYPVVISSTSDKTSINIISIWKNLGSPTASYSGNHSNGTSSMWLIFEGRSCTWDGNGGYYRTIYKSQPYATLISEANIVDSSVSVLCVYLRGGGTEYNISTTYPASVTVYLSATNIGSSTYPANVIPRTDIGNGGIINGTFYGNITGNANTANTATKLGTSTIGSTTKGIYLDGGTPKAMTYELKATVNAGKSGKLAYYSGDATISVYNSSVGNGAKPIYMYAGVPTASTANIGSGTKPIFMSSGTLTESSSTVGSGTKPIFMSSGTLTAFSATIGSSSQPVYLNAGVITACSSMALSGHTHTFAQITNKLTHGAEFNFVDQEKATVWFNYRRASDSAATTPTTQFNFGQGTASETYANIKAQGFIKNGSSDNYLLRGAGGHIAWGNGSSQIPYSNGTVNTNLNADLLDGYHALGITNTSNYLIKQSYINPGADENNDHWYRIATIKPVGSSNYKVLLYISTNYPNRQSALVEITYRTNSGVEYHEVTGYVGTIPAANIRLYYDTTNYSTVSAELCIFIAKSSTGSRTVNTRVIAEVQRGVQFPNIITLDNNVLIEASLSSYTAMTYANFLGNASTATKLGTSTIGSTTKGIYLDGGTPKAMTYELKATVNAGTSGKLAYYSGDTAISVYNSSVGNGAKPIYMYAGVPTASTTNIGSGTKPIFMSSGTLTESSSTVGSGTKPIFMSSGTLTAFSATIGSSSQPVYLNAGVITACTNVANSSHTHTFAQITNKLTHGDEFNFVDQEKVTVWFNYRRASDSAATTPTTQFNFGQGTATGTYAYLMAEGFKKNGSSDNYLLRGGGGHIAWGNGSGQIPYSNGTVNTNLNADLLDGYHAGVQNGQVSIFVPWPSIATMKSEGLLTTNYGTSGYGHPDEVYLQAICKWAIAHYTNLGDVTLIGSIAPNSSGTVIMHLYSSSGKDSTTLLPRYCASTYQNLSGYIYEFGCVNYVWYYRRLSAGNADIATRLGTSTIGSTTKGIYLDGGTPKAMTYELKATVNSGTSGKLAYYSGDAAISVYNSSVGNGAKPIYMYAGVPTASTANIGSGTKPIFMSSGTLTESSSTVGSGTKPIFMSSGTLTAFSATIGSSSQPVYLNAGVITACTNVANSSHTHTFAQITTKITNTNEFNFVDAEQATIWFNYRRASNSAATTATTQFNFGRGTATEAYANIKAQGFIKNGSSDNYLLRGGGGHIAYGNSSGYVPLSNGTINTNLNADLLDGTHKADLLTAASLGASGNNTTLSVTVGGTTKTGSVTVPYSTKTKTVIAHHTITGSGPNNAQGKWIKFATIDLSSGNWTSFDETWIFGSTESPSATPRGILKLNGNRAGNNDTISAVSLKWLTLENIWYKDKVVLYKRAANTYDVYISNYGTYETMNVVRLTGYYDNVTFGNGTWGDLPGTALYTSSLGGNVSNADYASNADKLDGYHANGLFTVFGASGNALSLTIGGTTRTYTPPYASNADTVDGYHASGLFTTFGNSGNNITATIGSTTKTFTVNYATNSTSTEYLNNYTISDPNTAKKDNKVKWFAQINSSSGYAGNNYGFPVSNNANGILYLGTHPGEYGHQLGFSSNGSIYRRYQNGSAFPTTANGGSWLRILDSGNSSVSGGGSSFGSSITVTINGITKTLTIPSNPNTDYRVTQNSDSANTEYRVLFKYTANDTNETNTVKYNTKFRYNPSTGNIFNNGNFYIDTGDNDRFIQFRYNSNNYAGAAWRLISRGSGSGDTNYFDIETGGSDASSNTWYRVIRLTMDNRRVGIGTDSPSDKLDVGGYIRSSANSRYLQIGPQNTSWAHYNTNADTGHWFNKRVDVNGDIRLHSGNGHLLSTGQMYAKGYHFIGNDNNNYVLLAGGSYKQWTNNSTANALVSRNGSGDIYVRYAFATLFNSSTGDENPTIGSVYIRNTSDNYIRRMSISNFISQITPLVDSNDTVSFTKSLTVTEAWMDTGIVVNTTNFPKGSGTYAIQISHSTLTTPGDNGYASLYSGIISIYTDGTNSTTDSEEVILHRAGHAWVRRIYIRTMPVASTGNCKIQIAASKTWTAASNVTFKFRKLI